MKKAEVISIPHLCCANCGHLMGRVDHLNANGNAGPWYCDDCGIGWYIQKDAAGDVLVEDKGKRKEKTLVLLDLKPDELNDPLRLVVQGMRFNDQEDDAARLFDQSQYFYEEHTCPSNYLRTVEHVFLGENSDPHGLFNYIGEMKKADFAGETCNMEFGDIAALLKERR